MKFAFIDEAVMSRLFVGIIALVAMLVRPQLARADAMADCQNRNLPLAVQTQACNTAIQEMRLLMRKSGVGPNGKTRISGAFDGCNYGKKFDLDNGYTMVCQSYGYHYAYSPEAIIVDGIKAYIDGNEYSITIE